MFVCSSGWIASQPFIFPPKPFEFGLVAIDLALLLVLPGLLMHELIAD